MYIAVLDLAKKACNYISVDECWLRSEMKKFIHGISVPGERLQEKSVLGMPLSAVDFFAMPIEDLANAFLCDFCGYDLNSTYWCFAPSVGNAVPLTPSAFKQCGYNASHRPDFALPVAWIDPEDIEMRGFDTSGLTISSFYSVSEKMGDMYLDCGFGEDLESIVSNIGLPMASE